MPTELERDAKGSMEPLLAGALLHRLSDIDLIRLNGWLDGERRAAADEVWERHKDTVAATNGLLAALEGIANLEPGSQGAFSKFMQAKELARRAIAQAKGGA